jgi:hypothetical protein
MKHGGINSSHSLSFYLSESIIFPTNRWDTRIKMLNTDKDGKDTNLKALKLVQRFIEDCRYLNRRCYPVDPFPC